MLSKQLNRFASTITEIGRNRNAKKEAAKDKSEINKILKTLKDGRSNS
jgi:hypothetical protein